ncbi:sigma-54-dependent transcriptional regulator [Tuwongella immobilis]|uniref:DNA-binding transcriptional regulator NtrC n=1 Tax=Tuwongella immobilis TaxID=692036 RepID=A0A6C2YN16_9BACT|nr:sigma-54 dependent transcriptional regulator [Tuwongella immobilis]VIP02998.1 response regulator with -like aaa-type and dna-binding domains : Response regulator with CheY-like receiver, AAA-type ATPase, and DNA-binding domains OS=Singulisphaera acidiphila (strain ATCC BAA-1392 / DSM 18658 / VKM B-2454 / MOB10) GN=Sinac_1278 PE=4 SV=1: Response_reg: Sigma54_activat: HTH_8 [Tuwongella immobilis]VTS03082.1 response regulator with -like aaa-type and dna-binding domains : Response regulator with C
MQTLLVIDDEPAIQHAFRRAFGGKINVLGAATAREGLSIISQTPPDVIVLDVHLPDATGLETYRKIHQIDARIPVILITGHGTTDLAIEAMKDGVYEYLLKPLELSALRRLIEQAMLSAAKMRIPANLGNEESVQPEGDLMLGQCARMQDVYKSVGRVAAQEITVLIQGESGTGKELVARAIYQHSKRAKQPFLAINCAAIPETLLESELFGHEKGSFTGAERKRIGKFEQCHGGTIFLDEIGEMPILMQSKILRLLQEQQFERVGGNELIQTNVRLIAATNADLKKLCDVGKFRKDLYFRLNVFSIELPPLRDRGGDIDQLIDYFVKRYSLQLGRSVTEIAQEARDILHKYPWPGNVRELQSVIKQSLIRMNGSALLADFLPESIRQSDEVDQPIAVFHDEQFSWDSFIDELISQSCENVYAVALERMEREVILRVLKHTGGNQLQSAKILGITRGSLRTKIRNLGINIGRNISLEDEEIQ